MFKLTFLLTLCLGCTSTSKDFTSPRSCIDKAAVSYAEPEIDGGILIRTGTRTLQRTELIYRFRGLEPGISENPNIIHTY
jgi:hypothetical protein